MAEAAVRKAASASCPPGVDSDLKEHLAGTAAGVLEDCEGDSAAFRDGLLENVKPFLEDLDISEKDAVAFCDALQRAAFPSAAGGGAAAGDKKRSTGADSNGGRKEVAADDILCRMPNLMMMYGGSAAPLLKNTTLELIKGHLYGVVGKNGTGKSTLVNRIACKDIAGFPEAIKVVHLSHDKFLQGTDASMCVREYVEIHRNGAGDIAKAIVDVGFDAEMSDKALSSLSGGWQMRFALACAVAQKANLLVLDEPTNHLDAAGVRWLVGFLNSMCIAGSAGGAAVIISHDPQFLNQTCTDIIHFTTDGKLAYNAGNFDAFKATVLKGSQVEADKLLEASSSDAAADSDMFFPTPDKLGATAAARKLPVLTLQGAGFSYADGKAVLSDIDVRLTMESRVAVVGANGAGKSTLLALLADRMKPSSGELWWHKNLRMSYVAQSHLTHLGENLGCTPVQYIQERFRCGFDSTTPEKEARVLTEAENDHRRRRGTQFGKKSKPVEAILARREDITGGAHISEKQYSYLTHWEGLGDAERSWERRGKLNTCGAGVMCDDLDSRLWSAWAGVEERTTAEGEVLHHLEGFGLSKDLCHRKISTFSGGQKVKLMFGAALWTKPHVLCLDEPTNYLDVESVAMLQKALVDFRGGYAVVTHNQAFAEEISNETWTVADGHVSGAKRVFGKQKIKPKAKAPSKDGYPAK